MAHSLPVPPPPRWVVSILGVGVEPSSKHILCLEFLFCKWQECLSQRGL